jgi:transitional endoplasmic reticulum ATPase
MADQVLRYEVTTDRVEEALAGAGPDPVEMLREGDFPEPVRGVRFLLARTYDTHVLTARITTSGVNALPPAWRSFVTPGNDPIGVLLSKRVAAGDRWAAMLVDGVGDAAAELHRRLATSPPREVRTVVVPDGEPLNMEVTPDGRGGLVLRTGVPSDTVRPAHVRAVFAAVLDAVAEIAADGRTGLAGRRYVLGPGTAMTAPTASKATRPPAEESSETVTLDQVGGLDAVVTQFREIAVSFKHPDAMARWGARRPQGILLYGPPGTGKTMLARALANEVGARFREVRTPEILDKWLGASERNIKRIFAEARRYREPTVLLFDEFDSIITYAGAGDDAASHAVSAVAGIFKQEMNTLIEANPLVIVVATTNFPQRVDESLIRSGRFDVKIAIPRPDATGRAEIMRTMIRDLARRYDRPGFRMFDRDVDPVALVAEAPGLTGADLREVLRRARLAKAMHEARTGDRAAPISHDDLARGIAELKKL